MLTVEIQYGEPSTMYTFRVSFTTSIYEPFLFHGIVLFHNYHKDCSMSMEKRNIITLKHNAHTSSG